MAFADGDAVPVVGAVAWFDVDGTAPQVPAGFPARLRTILDELAHRRGPDGFDARTSPS